ncbi:thioredoxin family protein [Billgrantia pellis]|uniref:Thioredoxin family protein n=1 Tax=Billgrantia pellis TaxID=2606936 RepID=A0A7V7G0R7_9GAMM|nr:thioredoxin family protein [Halomonas pellis]KAA0013021.1 thioredoxin family protein [Halomonas pellis]
MPMQHRYLPVEPSLGEIKRFEGLAVIEFGAPWCGYCLAMQPPLEAALAGRDDVRHLKIEDGRGRRLGRAFRVKLWPTLIFLDGGAEVARLVRPTRREAIEEILERIAA